MSFIRKTKKLFRSPKSFFKDSFVFKSVLRNDNTKNILKDNNVKNTLKDNNTKNILKDNNVKKLDIQNNKNNLTTNNSYWSGLSRDKRSVAIISGSNADDFQIKINEKKPGKFQSMSCLWIPYGNEDKRINDLIVFIRNYRDQHNNESFKGFDVSQMFITLYDNFIFPHDDFDVHQIIIKTKNGAPSFLNTIQNHIFINPTSYFPVLVEKWSSRANIIIVLLNDYEITNDIYDYAKNDYIIITERILENERFSHNPAIITSVGNDSIADTMRQLIVCFSERQMNHLLPIFGHDHYIDNIFERSKNNEYDGLIVVNKYLTTLYGNSMQDVVDEISKYVIAIYVREDIYLRFFHLHNKNNTVESKVNKNEWISLFFLTTMKYGVKYDVIEHITH